MPAAWTTPRSTGIVESISVSTAASSSRRATSAANARTSAPMSRSSSISAEARVLGSLRPTSATLRAPRTDEVPGDGQADPAEATRDEVGAMCRHRRTRLADHDLAGMSCLRHVAERFRHRAGVERGERQRLQLAGGEPRHHLGEHRPDGRRVADGKVAEEHDVVGDVGALCGHALVGPHGAPADLEESATVGQHVDAALDEVVGERVEHGMHAGATRRCHQLVGEVE